jgi:conjugal transfer/entry exclusion protein
MSETTVKQLTPEELQSIQDMQKQYNQFVFELGSVESQLQNIYKAEADLKTEKANIVEDITKLGEREKELVNTLQTKYGVGSINPQTGEITPL